MYEETIRESEGIQGTRTYENFYVTLSLERREKEKRNKSDCTTFKAIKTIFIHDLTNGD
jgi:hypothetical protein